MKRLLGLFWCHVAVSWAITGCHPQPGDPAAAEAVVEIGPKYIATKGLLVPEETRVSIGLDLVDVTERVVSEVIEWPIRIYRSGAVSSLASGSVTPEQAQRLKDGQDVHVSTGDGRELSAKITGIHDSLAKETGFAEVLLEMPFAATDPLIDGAFLTARVTPHPGAPSIAIPRSALLESSDGVSVYTASGESFVRTPVKVGAMNDELVEIKEGLYAGDQVVSKPVMALWMMELAAVKGGQACCVVPPKGK